MVKIPDDTNKTKRELVRELEKIDREGGFIPLSKLFGSLKLKRSSQEMKDEGRKGWKI